MNDNNQIDESIEDEAAKFQQALVALGDIKKRCDAAKIKYSDLTSVDFESIDLRIQFPCGRDTRQIFLWNEDDVLGFHSIYFERYTLLGNYAAIASYDEGVIEAVISAPSANTPLSRNRLKRILGVIKTPEGPSKLTLRSPTEKNPITISIKNVGNDAKVLAQPGDSIGLSLEISNAGVKTHDEAIELLRKTSNALFFSIDLQKGIHLSLIRNGSRRKRERPYENDLKVQYPRHVYDNAPMDLYWYARSATKMPLLQFLAYYQVLEFYYPVFYNAEISRRIRGLIKSPTFRVDSESDISRIVSTIKTRGLGFGSEREQLKATLKECIDNEDILAFLNQSKERTEFFNSKAKGITSCLLNTQNKNTDMYVQVAERIYSIRCKIVHTKGDDNEGEIELLLPYSNEAEKLDEDIELVKFVAQQVMIYASKELST